jgi:hypothetical protein
LLKQRGKVDQHGIHCSCSHSFAIYENIGKENVHDNLEITFAKTYLKNEVAIVTVAERGLTLKQQKALCYLLSAKVIISKINEQNGQADSNLQIIEECVVEAKALVQTLS